MPNPKKRKNKPGAGRPTDYNPKYIPIVKKLFTMGTTDNEVIDSLGIARSTFYLWKKEHADFAEAIREGKDFFDNGEVESSLMVKARGFYTLEEVTIKRDAKGDVLEEIIKRRTQPPDTQALKYWLNNRQPERWKDRPEEELKNLESPELQADRQAHLDGIARQNELDEEVIKLLAELDEIEA